MTDEEKPKREAQFLNMDSELMQALEDPETRRALIRQMEKQQDEEKQKPDKPDSDCR